MHLAASPQVDLRKCFQTSFFFLPLMSSNSMQSKSGFIPSNSWAVTKWSNKTLVLPWFLIVWLQCIHLDRSWTLLYQKCFQAMPFLVSLRSSNSSLSHSAAKRGLTWKSRFAKTFLIFFEQKLYGTSLETMWHHFFQNRPFQNSANWRFWRFLAIFGDFWWLLLVISSEWSLWYQFFTQNLTLYNFDF